MKDNPNLYDPEKKTLIIFVKVPAAGEVKTRLARDVGNEQALRIYKQLIGLTFAAAEQSEAEVFVFWNREPNPGMSVPDSFHGRLQQGITLGERMQNAFREILSESYGQVCIIGSDCPQLTASHINDAFRYLNATDIVIGPARDGGYYLLGMKQDHTWVFGLEKWSHDEVFEQTMELIAASRLSYGQLEQLSDLDDIADYTHLKHHLEAFAGLE